MSRGGGGGRLLATVYSKSFRFLSNRILAFFLSVSLAKMSTDAKKKKTWIQIEPHFINIIAPSCHALTYGV